MVFVFAGAHLRCVSAAPCHSSESGSGESSSCCSTLLKSGQKCFCSHLLSSCKLVMALNPPPPSTRRRLTSVPLLELCLEDCLVLRHRSHKVRRLPNNVVLICTSTGAESDCCTQQLHRWAQQMAWAPCCMRLRPQTAPSTCCSLRTPLRTSLQPARRGTSGRMMGINGAYTGRMCSLP